MSQPFYQSLISAKSLHKILERKDLILFDCRFDLADTEKKRAEYQMSHISGALYAHLDEHLSSPVVAHTGRHPMPDIHKLLQWLSECGFNGSQQVVVYDDSFGAMATRLWWLLKNLGHENVALLDGGWQAWSAAKYPVTSKQRDQTNGLYSAEFDSAAEVTTADVLRNLDTAEFLLIDVRANERFIGAKEPIDPVAGHIPGAINIPLTDNLDAQGCYLSQQRLKAIYDSIAGRSGDIKPVFMCGSGVTACHSVLAMELAGFERPRVYTGSWSEWIRDSSRPIATGP